MGKPLILATGASGTIGSRLVPRLAVRGVRARALVRTRGRRQLPPAVGRPRF